MSEKSKVTSTLDVEVLLSGVVGDNKTLMRHVDIFKEKGKSCALIQIKQRMRGAIWSQINRQVKEWGGRWRPSQRLWEVPLT